MSDEIQSRQPIISEEACNTVKNVLKYGIEVVVTAAAGYLADAGTNYGLNESPTFANSSHTGFFCHNASQPKGNPIIDCTLNPATILAFGVATVTMAVTAASFYVANQKFCPEGKNPEESSLLSGPTYTTN